MRLCSISQGEWDPKTGFPERVAVSMTSTAKMIGKDVMAASADVRLNLLTLVLITPTRGAA
jgi:hypothetical protein